MGFEHRLLTSANMPLPEVVVRLVALLRGTVMLTLRWRELAVLVVVSVGTFGKADVCGLSLRTEPVHQ
jgi:hypothetical protein